MLWGAARRVDALCRKRFGRNGRGKLGVGWDVWGTFENVFFETKISLWQTTKTRATHSM